jgi:hypothetical protein
VVGRWLSRVVQGYFNYHTVPGNVDPLDAFRQDVLGRGYMRYDGEGSVDECPGPSSGVWSNATSRGLGCSTRIRIDA